MRIKWSECITTDPDIPPDCTFIERSGEVLNAVHTLIGTRLVVMCDDGHVRECAIDAAREC